MKNFSYIITDPLGLHARPAGLLVKEAQKHAEDITLSLRDKSADLKKLFAVMKLGVKHNDEICCTVTGENEEKVAVLLLAYLQQNL